MQKIILGFGITIVMVSFSIVGFGQESKPTNNACKNIVEIKDEKKLIKSRLDSDADYNKYKNEADLKIKLNQKKIEELKALKPNLSEENTFVYNKKIADIEQKNNILRAKIYDSFMTKTCAWPEFKTDFNVEMEELQLEIKNIGIDNPEKANK